LIPESPGLKLQWSAEWIAMEHSATQGVALVAVLKSVTHLSGQEEAQERGEAGVQGAQAALPGHGQAGALHGAH
jgi:hypothetical protein